MRRALALFMTLGLVAAASWAQAPAPEVPAAARALPLDALAATRAWLDLLPVAQRARTDAYFEGGYWLMLWSTLVTVGVAWLLLASGASRRLRAAAERVSPRRTVQVALYAIAFLAAFSLVTLPWSIYTDWWREQQYGLSNQSFAAWAGEAAIGFALTLLFGTLALMAIYAVVRRAPRTWWLWGAGVMMAFSAFGALIYPPFIAPLFNDYRPVTNVPVREAVLSLARANGVPADEVYEFNASRQHKRISANVAGLGGTMRIALNDNLLNRASMGEIRMVMAHEIGHYVLNHVVDSIVFSGVVTVAMFALARAAFARAHARWGARWGVRDVADPAGLPILVAALAVLQLLASPLTNTLTRVQEVEADRFGLAASREPDGFAAAALKLGEYRKMEPSPLEEAIFFTHPSGRARVEMAMRWKAEAQRDAPAAK